MFEKIVILAIVLFIETYCFIDSRRVNLGLRAETNEFPFQAHLYIPLEDGGSSVCSGSCK